MASIIRIGVSRLVNIPSSSSKQVLLARKELTFVRSISGKTLRCEDILRPRPYPYHDKPYTMLNRMFDKTSARFNENSKIIVVEGPVAAGKSKLAKQLADELEMLYMPEANLDMVYINHYGFDLRKLDEELPPDCRSFDVNNFLLNPKHKLTARFQMQQFEVKFSQYIDALAHVLSTGQGVVLDRCYFSDFVFVEAMRSQNYLSKIAANYYYEVRRNTIFELLKPHLVIYLDVPVKKVKDNISSRNIPYEKNSPALTTEYLSTMEKVYKQQYLKDISNHAELLIYDWSEEGDIEVVVEDVERIDFGKYDDQDTQMKDWSYCTEEDWAVLRHKYADKKDELMMIFYQVPPFHVPELLIEAEDLKLYHEILESAPGQRYEKGFNAQLGDDSLLFKAAGPNRDTLPLRERRQHN